MREFITTDKTPEQAAESIVAQINSQSVGPKAKSRKLVGSDSVTVFFSSRYNDHADGHVVIHPSPTGARIYGSVGKLPNVI
jgi:hypothetical protein